MTSTNHSLSFFILGIILGAIFSAFGVSVQLASDINQNQQHIALLTSDYETAQTTLASMNLSLHDAQSTLLLVNTTLLETQTTLASVNRSFHDALATLVHVNSEKVSLASNLTHTQNEVTELQTKIDNIFTITVTQHFTWNCNYNEWLWDLPIPLELYITYWERPRPSSWASWAVMANDFVDDAFLTEMAYTIYHTAQEAGFTERETINYVIAFVQSLPYTVDKVSTPGNDYPKYPIETLFERGGDCEDTSILAAAILDQMGFDVALLILYNEDHCAVGIATEASGSYYEYEGKEYYYLETTGEGWQLGEIPSELEDTRANIYPIAD